jgi:hypothetical protein
LLAGCAAAASPMPPARQPLASGDGTVGIALSADFSIWALLGHSIVFIVGFLLVIPAPWVAVSFYRWFISCVRVPQRPNLGFSGQPLDIWWVFALLALFTYAGFSGIPFLRFVLIPVQAYLSWMTLKWVVENVTSNGQPLQLSFRGDALHYVGWYVLLNISFLTIIGWAWVTTAWTRWMFRNIDGTRREIVFNASGLDVLWRTLVFAIGCAFVIPIPWALGWYVRWYMSQIALAPRA